MSSNPTPPHRTFTGIRGPRLLFFRQAGTLLLIKNILLLGPLLAPWLQASDLSPWMGPWTMAGSSSASQYSINFAPQNQDLKFILDASSGAHSGTIEGVAQVKNPNQAVWEEMHQDATPPYTSKLTFTKKGDTLTVSAQNTETYGGAGISFDDGTYQRGLAQVDPHPLVTRGLLTPSEDDRVRALTGADYPLVVTCLHLVRQDEIKEKNFQGKVIDGFVRGLAPEMNARMTIENDGAITVGVTDCEQKQIRIYTTRPDRKIPAPFDLWDNSRYPVLLVPPTK